MMRHDTWEEAMLYLSLHLEACLSFQVPVWFGRRQRLNARGNLLSFLPSGTPPLLEPLKLSQERTAAVSARSSTGCLQSSCCCSAKASERHSRSAGSVGRVSEDAVRCWVTAQLREPRCRAVLPVLWSVLSKPLCLICRTGMIVSASQECCEDTKYTIHVKSSRQYFVHGKYSINDTICFFSYIFFFKLSHLSLPFSSSR